MPDEQRVHNEARSEPLGKKSSGHFSCNKSLEVSGHADIQYCRHSVIFKAYDNRKMLLSIGVNIHE